MGILLLLNLFFIAYSLSTNNTLYVSVFDFGAKGDGVTDDTDAFQKALDFVGNINGGIVNVPPPHVYKIEGTLNIPKQTLLQGGIRTVQSHAVVFKGIDPLKGSSTLLAYSGKGSEEGTSFITMNEDSSIKGFTIYYPEQPNTGNPTPYPWTIEVSNCNNAAIFDIELLNSYQGILLNEAHRHFVSRVEGQPLKTGIYVDSIYDIGRIENVHFNPWWSQDETLLNWQKTNGVAFVFGRTDWEYVFNTFAFAYKIGYHFIETSTGACNGNFLGIGADLATYASVLVEQSQPMGLLITNGEFTSFQGDESTHIRVSKTNTGSVRLNNCNFWGPSIRNAELHGSGTVSFNGCVFVQWNETYESVLADNGNVQIMGSEWQMNGKQLNLKKGCSKCAIVGNIITGKKEFSINCKKQEEGLNCSDD